MSERITIEITWTAPDGTLQELEDDGGDGTLIEAALTAFKEGAIVDVASSSKPLSRAATASGTGNH